MIKPSFVQGLLGSLCALILGVPHAFALDPAVVVKFGGGDIPLANPDLLVIRGFGNIPVQLEIGYDNIPVTTQRSVAVFVNGKKLQELPKGARTGVVTLRDGDVQWSSDKKNPLEVRVARDAGPEIVSNTLNIVGTEFPAYLRQYIFNNVTDGLEFTASLSIPPNGFDLSTKIPLIGRYGPQFQLLGSLTAGIVTKEVSAEVAGGVSWYSGANTTTISVGGNGSADYQKKGSGYELVWNEFGAFLEWEKTYQLAKLSLFLMLPNEAQLAITRVPLVGEDLKKFIDGFAIYLNATPNFRGTAVIEPEEKPAITRLTFDGSLDVRATINAYLEIIGGKYGIEGYVGAKPSAQIQFPTTPAFKHLLFQAYIGATLHIGPWSNDYKYTFINVSQGSPRSFQIPLRMPELSPGWTLIQVAGKPIAFPLAKRVLDPQVEASLKRFVSLTNRTLSRSGPERTLRAASAVLPLATNASLISYPALSSRGKQLMVVFANDTRTPGSTESGTQFTKLLWTRFDGARWSAPAPLPTSTGGAQLQPDLCHDGSGRTIAAWQQMRNPDFNSKDPGTYLNHNELALSVFTPGSSSWSAPLLLGSPEHGDLNPYVRGPLANGDAMVFWLSSKVPKFLGKETTATPDAEYKMVIWDNRSSKWLNERVVMPYPRQQFGLDFDAAGTKGVLVMGWDPNSDDSLSDTEIRFRVFDTTTRSWGGFHSLTSDQVEDTNPAVLVTTKGDVLIAWSRGGDLVIDRNFENRPTVVRKKSDGTRLGEVVLRDVGLGRIALSWTEDTAQGQSVISRLYDPATGSWSRDLSLTPGMEVETLCDVSSDPAGNLIPLFLQTEIAFKPQSAPDKSGDVVRVENVPVPGARSIRIAKFRPSSELGLVGLTAAPGKPEEPTVVKVRIVNRGLLGARFGEVSFYSGNPAKGGTKLATQRSGVIPGGGEVTVSLRVAPGTEVREIYAKLEGSSKPAKSLRLDGLFLRAMALGGRINPDGSARVEILVENYGVPNTGYFEVGVFNEADERVATVKLTNLASGQSVRKTFHLPKGSATPSGSEFEIRIDPKNEMPRRVKKKTGDTLLLRSLD